MAPEEPNVQAITYDFAIHIDERDLALDPHSPAHPDIITNDGQLDIGRLVVALNREQIPNEEIVEGFIRTRFREEPQLRSRRDPDIPYLQIVEALYAGRQVVTELRFARGSVDVFGRVTLIVTDPVIREIAKDALIALAAQGVQKGAASAVTYILRSFGIQLTKPVTNAQVITIDGVGTQGTINPLPTPKPAETILKMPPLQSLVRLSAANLIVSFVILLALVLYMLRILP